MKLVIKRCHTCGALGVGPKAVKLWSFEGRMYCKEDYKDPLTWHESRGAVTSGIRSEVEFASTVLRMSRWRPRERRERPQDWRGFIQECAGLAEFGLLRGDQKIFVRYFAKALWAWSLSQGAI